MLLERWESKMCKKGDFLFFNIEDKRKLGNTCWRKNIGKDQFLEQEQNIETGKNGGDEGKHTPLIYNWPPNISNIQMAADISSF